MGRSRVCGSGSARGLPVPLTLLAELIQSNSILCPQACDSPTVGKCDKSILKTMGFWYSSRNCFSFTHWAVPCPSETAVLGQLLPSGGA